MQNFSIRLCKSWDECVECEELQKLVWEMQDYRDAVPANLLITAIKNGGLLVGAFEETRMVGFAFGFLGYDYDGGAPRLKHTSHMLGVLPEMRVYGLGAELKWFQRAEALAQGLDLMTWTYDPLQSVNAYLNLTRLGAIARRYYRDAYGEMTDALNIGLASDRFQVEWHLRNERVKRLRAAGNPHVPLSDAPSVYRIEWTALGFPVIVDENPLRGEILRVEIPSDITVLKRDALPLAIQWRERTRSTFERAFASGYIATRVDRETRADGRQRVWYILELRPDLFDSI